MGEQPHIPEGPQVNIASHTIEMAMTARVISDAQGKPVSIILTGQHGMEIKAPGEAYPFVKNGALVLTVVTVVQVTGSDAASPPKGLIRTGA